MIPPKIYSNSLVIFKKIFFEGIIKGTKFLRGRQNFRGVYSKGLRNFSEFKKFPTFKSFFKIFKRF